MHLELWFMKGWKPLVDNTVMSLNCWKSFKRQLFNSEKHNSRNNSIFKLNIESFFELQLRIEYALAPAIWYLFKLLKET